jgi:RHS repeat-associated protein
VIKQTGTVVNPYLYAGYRYDKETGLYYLQARYYDAKSGRFLTLDPDLGEDEFPLTQNGYSYVNNNPVMKIDPDGHWAKYIFKVVKYLYKRYRFYGPDLKSNGRLFAIVDRQKKKGKKKGGRIFAVDYHEVYKKKGKKKIRIGKRLHFHFGNSKRHWPYR